MDFEVVYEVDRVALFGFSGCGRRRFDPIFGVVNSAANCRRHRWHIRNYILTAIITEQWGFVVINTGS